MLAVLGEETCWCRLGKGDLARGTFGGLVSSGDHWRLRSLGLTGPLLMLGSLGDGTGGVPGHSQGLGISAWLHGNLEGGGQHWLHMAALLARSGQLGAAIPKPGHMVSLENQPGWTRGHSPPMGAPACCPSHMAPACPRLTSPSSRP